MSNDLGRPRPTLVSRLAGLAVILSAPFLPCLRAGVVITDPSVILTVDGVAYPGTVTPDKKGYSFSGGTEQPGFAAAFHGFLNPDPSVSFYVGVTDVGTPSTFTLSITLPIVPTGSPNLVSASVGGTLTDVKGDGVSLTPSPGPLAWVGTVGSPNTSLGVDVGPAASHTSAPGSPPWSYSYGTFSAGPTAGPTPGPWTVLSGTFSFTLSGGEDVADLNGSLTITAVPEANGGLMVGAIALGSVALWRRRRA